MIRTTTTFSSNSVMFEINVTFYRKTLLHCCNGGGQGDRRHPHCHWTIFRDWRSAIPTKCELMKIKNKINEMIAVLLLVSNTKPEPDYNRPNAIYKMNCTKINRKTFISESLHTFGFTHRWRETKIEFKTNDLVVLFVVALFCFPFDSCARELAQSFIVRGGVE